LIHLTTVHDQARTEAKSLITASAQASAAHRPELNFLALALSSKKVDFSTVFKKIDEMIAILKQ